MEKNNSIKIIIAAGGTGGHIFPAMATGRKLRELDPKVEVLFLCGTRPLENQIYTNAGESPIRIPAKQLGSNILTYVFGFFSIFLCLLRCLGIFIKLKPKAIIGFGGYVSGAALLAGKLLGCKCVTHEANAICGKANRWLSYIVDVCAVNFEEARNSIPCKPEKVRVTKMPICNFAMGPREEALEYFDLDKDRKTVLIIGGSQGAQKMYQDLSDIVLLLDKDSAFDRWQLLWSTGKANYDALNEKLLTVRKPEHLHIKLIPFISRMDLALTVSDLAITRAGASTIAELTTARILPIFVPLPTAIYNHQELNARIICASWSGKMILQNDLSDIAKSAEFIKQFILSRSETTEKPAVPPQFDCKDASQLLAELVLSLCHNK